MLRQREPLRVPREWTGEKRSFVMAVERALDGLYKLFGRLTFSDFDKSLQDRIVSTEENVTDLERDKLNKIDSAGVARANANGNISYCKLLTLKIKTAYCNRPVLIEVSRRGGWFTQLQIEFANENSLDPALLGFYTDNDDNYFLYKASSGVWELYCGYNGSYGEAAVHRISGRGAAPSPLEISVTVVGEVSSLPEGYVKAKFWRRRYYRETQARVFAQLDNVGEGTGATLTSLPTTPGVYRVGAVIAGLPSGTIGYGPLIIFNGGYEGAGYKMYLFIDARRDFFYAVVTGNVLPTKWYKLTGTEVGLTT